MDVELDKRLKNLQTIMETNQASIKEEIKNIFSYLARENNSRVNEINTLRSTAQYNERVLKDFNELKEKLLTYKKLFWGTIGIIVSIIIIVLSFIAFMP